MRKCWWLICLLMMCYLCPAHALQEIVARRTELEGGFRIDYVNAAGEIVISEQEGYATKLVTYHDQNSRTEMYYDDHGMSMAISKGAFGRYIVDVEPDKMYITYLDADGVPMATHSGYTSILRTVANGNIVQEMYLDAKGEPFAISEGQYGYMRQYDEKGRISAVVYLDKDGVPSKTYGGYDEIRREYDDDGQLKYTWYYLNDNLITLKSGKAGILKTDVKEIPVDRKGNEIFILSDFLKQNHWLCWLAAILLTSVGVLMPKELRFVLLMCYCVFIAYMTILTREHTSYRINLELFWSYKQFAVSSGRRVEVLNNILLFIPFSALLYSLWPKSWQVVAVTILISVLIETTQLVLRAGVCQLDDVLNNGIGGILGLGLAVSGNRLVSKMKHQKTEDREGDNSGSA